jgi:hypothetical protein
MKKLLFTLALAALATSTYAQGTIQIANNAGTRFRINGAIPTAGTFPALSFGVFVGQTADSLSAEAVGGTGLGRSATTAGLITSDNPQAHQLTGFAGGTTVFVQIRAWEARLGNDWRAAQAGDGLFGQTDVRQVTLGPPSGPGTVVWSSTDLTKFQAINLTVVPEPSTIALAVLGLGSLLLFRRRK